MPLKSPELPTPTHPVRLVYGDCRAVLPTIPAASFDSIVTDPPYGLEFMGKGWDRIGGGRVSKPGIGERDTPWVSSRGWNGHRCTRCGHLPHGGSPCRCAEPDIRPVDNRWQEMGEWYRVHFSESLRVLKPGGYATIFGGTRTYHRLACALEDAGFEIRDCLMWMYGTGYPKGRGCLKPAWEPILLARKPGKRVLPLGINACRIPTTDSQLAEKYYSVRNAPSRKNTVYGKDSRPRGEQATEPHPAGRYPANVVHDGSDEVMEAIGTAARFFYCAKAPKSERVRVEGVAVHPTQKPLSLMRWLVRLVTPEGGRTLDPFCGTGTTLLAAKSEGREALGIEQDAGYCDLIRARLTDGVTP